jgi:hypothetical protein
MRYTRKFIDARFHTAMDAIGAVHTEPYVKDDNDDWKPVPHCMFIDHNSVYGGYTIMQMGATGSGQLAPFGSNRHAAAEFVTLLSTIIETARFMRQPRADE